MTEKKITKDMSIMEIFEKNEKHAEQLAEVLSKFGLHCIGCSMAQHETIEGGILAHGMTEKDVKKIIDELNKVVSAK
jgi:CMP-N-acetylneuraminate monooxygenase